MRLTFIAITTLLAQSVSAQVEINQPLQLTGTGSSARVSGIESVQDAGDATSASAVQVNAVSYAAATNSGNAYAVTLTPAPVYTAGLTVHFNASADNTGAVTLNVNGLGVKSVRKNFNAELVSGDIRNGQLVSVMYDGSNFQMLSQLGNTGGPAACPSGFQSAGGFCIEANERSATNWTTANSTCMGAGARLCTPTEWKYACVNAGTFGLNNMLNNAREWSDQLVYETSTCDCSGYAISLGYNNGGTSSCTADFNFNSYSARDVNENIAYRCCMDR
jgi:hypothetical protein